MIAPHLTPVPTTAPAPAPSLAEQLRRQQASAKQAAETALQSLADRLAIIAAEASELAAIDIYPQHVRQALHQLSANSVGTGERLKITQNPAKRVAA
jgi:hypothetical protein